MSTLTRKPLFEVPAFFACLLIWPLATGEIGILSSMFVDNSLFRPKYYYVDSALFAPLLEVPIGLLPSTLIAIIVTIIRRAFSSRAVYAPASFLAGFIFAFPFSLALGMFLADYAKGGMMLEHPLFMSMTGGCVATLCSMPFGGSWGGKASWL